MRIQKRSILVTVDYEIFGNGTGDVRQHILAPTERMAKICERHGAPLTVYFEVEEYLAFVREREALVRTLGYDPAQEIKNQIIDLARRGHDIQLHLHPEWFNCTYVQGLWRLHPEKRTVDSLFETADEVTRHIRDRKAVIDDLLAEAGCPQRVTAYRAGAFCAQPGQKLLHALAANGFVLDSSVVKGMHRQDQHVTYDFSSAPAHRRHWMVREDVAREDRNGPIVEVPIYSRVGRRIQQLTPKRLFAKFSKHVPKDKQREMLDQLKIKKSPTSVLQFLFQRFPIKLDFHNMNSGQMLRWIRQAPPAPAGDLDVVVLIGHSKEHRDDLDFDRFLASVARDPNLEVISMHTLASRLRHTLARTPAGSKEPVTATR